MCLGEFTINVFKVIMGIVLGTILAATAIFGFAALMLLFYHVTRW